MHVVSESWLCTSMNENCVVNKEDTAPYPPPVDVLGVLAASYCQAFPRFCQCQHIGREGAFVISMGCVAGSRAIIRHRN